MKNKIISGLVIPLIFSATAWASDAVTPSSFTIKSIQNQGDACGPGTTAVNISEDREAFTVTFSDFVAEIGPNAQSESRRSCRLTFDTEQEGGWEFAVLGVTVRGFAQLDEGVIGRQVTQFGTKGKKADHALELRGFLEEDYVHAQQLPLEGLKWSGCNNGAKHKVKDFEVRTSAILRSENATGSGLLTVDSIDGQLEQVYEIAWRRCGEKGSKVVASCQIQGINGNSVYGKGTGRNQEAALAKANARLNQRCAHVKPAFGLCDVAAAQCSLSSL